MWWAVRNLARRHAADKAEYSEVYHGKTAAEWAEHNGLPNLSKELEYYVRSKSRSTDHGLEVETKSLALTILHRVA
jgi:hypothetical protein